MSRYTSIAAEIALELWDEVQQNQTVEQLRTELESLTQHPDEAQHQARAVAEGQPTQVRDTIEAYLREIPGQIRRTLQRPSDPTGLRLQKPEDLIPFLPDRLPRFKAGDRPLPSIDWELVELVGVGGFGEVWKVSNPHLRNLAPGALKFCLDAELAKSLRHEATMLDHLMRHGHHPGIVTSQQTFLNADPPCLQYEWVEGYALTSLIASWHRDANGPTAEEAARVILRLAEIVGHAHRLDLPLVHRDLKPANILVEQTGEGSGRFKITDFGIGGLVARQSLQRMTCAETSRGEVLATVARGAHTPLYSSPQQIRGEEADPRDDVYSLGVIWYQLMTGDMSSGAPTGRKWPRALAERGMSEPLIELLAECVEPDRTDRPADARLLADHLVQTTVEPENPRPMTLPQAIPVEQPPSSVPPPLPTASPVTESAPSPPSRRRLTVAAIGLSILLAVGWFGYALSTGLIFPPKEKEDKDEYKTKTFDKEPMSPIGGEGAGYSTPESKNEPDDDPKYGGEDNEP